MSIRSPAFGGGHWLASGERRQPALLARAGAQICLAVALMSRLRLLPDLEVLTRTGGDLFYVSLDDEGLVSIALKTVAAIATGSLGISRSTGASPMRARGAQRIAGASPR